MLSTKVTTVFLCVILALPCIEGLKGCSSFGHSCFGAHGKRGGENREKEFLMPSYDDVEMRQEVPIRPQNENSYDPRNDPVFDIIKQWMSNARARRNSEHQ